jgi:hypothetical protein
MIEAGRPRAGTRLITKRDRFAYRARVGVSRVFREPLDGPSADAVAAMAAIAAAVAEGHLTPGEASELSNMVGNYIKSLEAAEFDERLRALEAKGFATRP